MPSLVGGQADRDEQTRLSQQPEAEAEAVHPRREHQARVDAAELGAHEVERHLRVVGMVRAERPDEFEAFLTQVDPDHLVAEGERDLHGVVPEPAGRADDRDRATRVVPRGRAASSPRRTR